MEGGPPKKNPATLTFNPTIIKGEKENTQDSQPKTVLKREEKGGLLHGEEAEMRWEGMVILALLSEGTMVPWWVIAFEVAIWRIAIIKGNRRYPRTQRQTKYGRSQGGNWLKTATSPSTLFPSIHREGRSGGGKGSGTNRETVRLEEGLGGAGGGKGPPIGGWRRESELPSGGSGVGGLLLV